MCDPSSPQDRDQQLDQVEGIYSQPYNEIVKPDQIWPVSKYFLRRWTPYLTPTRFWTVIAARQLAYRLGDKRRFECYDGLLYKEAHTSRANFYRIKAEMDQADSAVSLFISRKPTPYQRDGDVTKPGPTIYYVRLDDVLTPGDAAHLTVWLQTQQAERRAEAVRELLQEASGQRPSELLAPSLAPYLADPPARFQAITVADIVERVFGKKIAQDTAVRKAAEALHTHLTAAVYIGTQYFRHHWLNQLGAGPTVLLTYLRSYCFLNEETGEIRDQVTITRPQLADALGIDRTTLFRWLKKIDKITPTEQPFYPFLELIDTQKTAGNEVESTYRVQLHEPLIGKHLALYRERIQAYQLAAVQNETHNNMETSGAPLQNEIHTNGGDGAAAVQNETHTTIQDPDGTLQNETHTQESSLQNETHAAGTVAEKDPQVGSAVQNETASVAEVDAYKHLNTLLQVLEEKSKSTFAAAADAYPGLLSTWKLAEGGALASFAEAAVSNVDGFCQAVAIEGRRSRDKVAGSGLSLTQMVAWYLYVLTQNGLSPDARPGYIINRAQEGEPPPAEFHRLASLSWELWRCYACLLELPRRYRQYLQDAPGYEAWHKQYGHCRPAALPLGVGEGITEFIELMLYGEQEPVTATDDFAITDGVGEEAGNGRTLTLTPPSDQERLRWHSVLDELELQMTKATFDTWLKDAQLLGCDGPVYVIGVHNKYAQEWLENRLHPMILRTMNAVMQTEVQLRFEVWNPDIDGVQAVGSSP
jgi:hypothetical protein